MINEIKSGLLWKKQCDTIGKVWQKLDVGRYIGRRGGKVRNISGSSLLTVLLGMLYLFDRYEHNN